MQAVTYYGHACFSVLVAGKRLLFDPFFEAKPEHVKVAPPDYVLLTHAHDDHVADALRLLQESDATLVANVEIVDYFKKKGITQVEALNSGGQIHYDWGSIRLVPAWHSSVFNDEGDGGVAGGFIVESYTGNFYVSGDTALSADMKMWGELYHLDWAALCVGGRFTMDAKEAALCAQWLGVEKVMGVHFDTFPVLKIDHLKAKASFLERHIELLLPAAGEGLSFEKKERKQPFLPVRTGIGYDIHQCVQGRLLVLGGVQIAHDKGLDGHSDADVLSHAVADAILGALGLPDIGFYFPPDLDAIEGISSLKILEKCRELLDERNYILGNIDATLVAEAPKVLPHVQAMKSCMSQALGIHATQIGIKATTNERLGALGRKEGIAAMATALILAR